MTFFQFMNTVFDVTMPHHVPINSVKDNVIVAHVLAYLIKYTQNITNCITFPRQANSRYMKKPINFSLESYI